MKKIIALSLSFIAILLGIPLSFCVVYKAQETVLVEATKHTSTIPLQDKEEEDGMVVTVFRTEQDKHQQLPLEEYLVGVVAAEMPALFELEALKAQAISARTYALRVLENKEYILDTVEHQAFQDEMQLRERWGETFDENHARIREAVEATEGLVLTHEGNLVKTFFFSTSNGRTENSEDYFIEALPYLRSVNSEWDRHATGFEEEVSFNLIDFRNRLEDNTLTFECINQSDILSRTTGGNVREVSIGNNLFTGREVRSKLDLRSADFSFETRDDRIYVTTLGNGHGVGMSQNGANQMALQGKNFEDILNHYYQNIKIIEKNSLN